MPQLNPTTKSRLIYIIAFLLLDGCVTMYLGYTNPSQGFALPAVIFSFLNFVAAITIGCLIYVYSKPEQDNMRANRSRE